MIAMGSDQHFCLRWNNFHSNIATSFEHLRDHEDFVDVTLACEGRSLKAHKVVLSACSPYFRNLLKVIKIAYLNRRTYTMREYNIEIEVYKSGIIFLVGFILEKLFSIYLLVYHVL